MFTTKCFIRKNTHELRKKLEEFGYKNRHLSMSTNVEHYPLLSVYHDGCYQGVFGDECGLEFYIDCGENEELFLTIAALSDDTDKYQWFYSTGWTDFEGNPLPDKWVFCDQDTLEHFAWVNNSPNSYKTGWKKATVEELIEHFKLYE